MGTDDSKKNTLSPEMAFLIGAVILVICVAALAYRIVIFAGSDEVTATVTEIEQVDRTQSGRNLVIPVYHINLEYEYNGKKYTGYLSRQKPGEYAAGRYVQIMVRKSRPKQIYGPGSMQVLVGVVVIVSIWEFIFYKVAIDPKNRKEAS